MKGQKRAKSSGSAGADGVPTEDAAADPPARGGSARKKTPAAGEGSPAKKEGDKRGSGRPTRAQSHGRARTGGVLARIALAPHIFWTVLFILVPLIFVVVYSFTDREMHFTLANMRAFFSPAYLRVFLRSAKLALISTVLCLLIGYPTAYFISRCSPRRQHLLIMLVMLPMWMNFLIRTYAWMVILQDTGILNSILAALHLPTLHLIGGEGAVVLGMVYDFLPYMILPIYTVLSKLDYRLVEAAEDLGCGKLGVLRRVILPLSLPGVVSGVTMVFVPSISTFYISQKLSGGKIVLIGDVIERQYYGSHNPHMAAALSLSLMLILLIGLFISNRFTPSENEREGDRAAGGK